MARAPYPYFVYPSPKHVALVSGWHHHWFIDYPMLVFVKFAVEVAEKHVLGRGHPIATYYSAWSVICT